MIFPDTKTESGDWLRYAPKSWRNQVRTLSGVRWFGILSRTGDYYQNMFPTYVGVKNNFKNFNEFVQWSQQEVGYDSLDCKGRYWVLDKDLLSSSEQMKHYSPESCILVPSSINGLMSSSKRKTSTEFLPLGVTVDAAKLRVKKTIFSLENSATRKEVQLHRGYNIYEAHRVYKISRLEDLFCIKDWARDIGHVKLECGIGNIIRKIEKALDERYFICDLLGNRDNMSYLEDFRDTAIFEQLKKERGIETK